MQLKKINKKENQRLKNMYIFLVFNLLVIGIFFIIPILYMIYYSFTDWNGFSNTYNYVGIENYTNILSPDNVTPLKNIFYYLVSAILQFFMGTYLAVYVYFLQKGKKILIILIIIPLAISTVAVGLIFLMFFQPGGGFDILLDNLHIIEYTNARESIKWVGNDKIVPWTLAIITLWKYTVFTFILMYSAMSSVNVNLIKSAKLAGASKKQITFNVLLPNIKLTISIVATMLIIGAITAYEIPVIITGGALDTNTILMRINEVAFDMRDYGVASVLSVIVIIIIVFILIGLRRVKTNEF